MRPIDAESKLKAIVEQLDTETLLSRLREFERGGHRPASMSDGRGGGDAPCPVAVKRLKRPDDEPWRPESEGATPPDPIDGPADPMDREIRTDRLLYESSLRHMVNAGQMALGIKNKYLIARTDDTAKAAALTKPPPGAGPCGNVWCDHACSGKGNDRLRKAPKRSGDDPTKANVARCQACDQHWRRHGVERDARRREPTVKEPRIAAATIAARNFVAANPTATPFVVACARRLDLDPGWLPSAEQTELLNCLALVTSNQAKDSAV